MRFLQSPQKRLFQALFWLFLCLLPAWSVVAADNSLRVVVSGVDGELRDNVEAALTVPEGLLQDGYLNRLWLRRYLRQAPDKVKKSLEPFGYYQAEASVLLEEQEEGRYVLQAKVKPGKAVRLVAVNLQLTGDGAKEKKLLEELKDFPLQKGDALRHDRYEQGKGQLLALAIDLGYLKAAFEKHEVNVTVAERRAELTLVLNTGPRFLFGDVTFPDPPNYPDRFLRRYLAFRPGRTFSHAELGLTQAQLHDSDRFKDVVITPRVDAVDAEDRVPIEIRLLAKPPRTLRPGIGYGTDTGARFSLRYKDVNVWQLGHEFTVDLLAAQLRQSLDLVYIFPHYRNVDSYTALKAGLNQEDTDTYYSSTTYAEAELVKKRNKGRLSFYLRLQREDYEVGDTDEISKLLIPGVRWSYRTYASPTRPLRGFRVGLEMRGTREEIFSDTSLFQVIADANTLIPLPGRFSLFLRGNGALTLQDNEFESIPVSLRFFAGGDQTVRGWGYQTLGPKDDSGAVVGGKHLAVASAELEKALGESWGVAVFYDIGNAFDSLSDYELESSAGIGVRWYTLVGPVKVDLARQLSETDPALRLHVSMGFSW